MRSYIIKTVSHASSNEKALIVDTSDVVKTLLDFLEDDHITGGHTCLVIPDRGEYDLTAYQNHEAVLKFSGSPEKLIGDPEPSLARREELAKEWIAANPKTAVLHALTQNLILAITLLELFEVWSHLQLMGIRGSHPIGDTESYQWGGAYGIDNPGSSVSYFTVLEQKKGRIGSRL